MSKPAKVPPNFSAFADEQARKREETAKAIQWSRDFIAKNPIQGDILITPYGEVYIYGLLAH